MPRLPLLSGKQIIEILQRVGYVVVRQRGSHIRLACRGKKLITIPDHATVGRGLLRKILSDAELPLLEFLRLSKKKK